MVKFGWAIDKCLSVILIHFWAWLTVKVCPSWGLLSKYQLTLEWLLGVTCQIQFDCRLVGFEWRYLKSARLLDKSDRIEGVDRNQWWCEPECQKLGDKWSYGRRRKNQLRLLIKKFHQDQLCHAKLRLKSLAWLGVSFISYRFLKIFKRLRQNNITWIICKVRRYLFNNVIVRIVFCHDLSISRETTTLWYD